MGRRENHGCPGALNHVTADVSPRTLNGSAPTDVGGYVNWTRTLLKLSLGIGRGFGGTGLDRQSVDGLLDLLDGGMRGSGRDLLSRPARDFGLHGAQLVHRRVIIAAFG